jgi:hypothetical protein
MYMTVKKLKAIFGKHLNANSAKNLSKGKCAPLYSILWSLSFQMAKVAMISIRARTI